MTPGELRRWRNAVFVIFFVQGIASASWVSRLPTIRDDTGLSVGETGTLLLAGSIGAVLGLTLSPILVSRLGAHRALVLTVSVGLSGVLGMGLAATLLGSAALVAVGLFAFGLGFGASSVLNNIEGTQAERAIGRTLLPLMHGFYSIGTVVGALLATLAAAGHLPVAWHFGLAVLGGGILARWALTMLPYRTETLDDGPSLPRAAWHQRLRESWSVWRTPVVWGMAACLLATSFSEGAANDWIALGMVDGHGFPNAMGALAFGLFVGGMTLIRLVGGPLIDRWGRATVFRLSVFGVLLGIAMFVTAPSLGWALAGATIWGLGIGLTFPTMMSAAADAPTNGAARVAAVSSVGYASGLVGPPVLGWIGAQVGVLNAQLALVPLLLLALLLGSAASGRLSPTRR